MSRVVRLCGAGTRGSTLLHPGRCATSNGHSCNGVWGESERTLAFNELGQLLGRGRYEVEPEVLRVHHYVEMLSRDRLRTRFKQFRNPSAQIHVLAHVFACASRVSRRVKVRVL